MRFTSLNPNCLHILSLTDLLPFCDLLRFNTIQFNPIRSIHRTLSDRDCATSKGCESWPRPSSDLSNQTDSNRATTTTKHNNNSQQTNKRTTTTRTLLATKMLKKWRSLGGRRDKSSDTASLKSRRQRTLRRNASLRRKESLEREQSIKRKNCKASQTNYDIHPGGSNGAFVLDGEVQSIGDSLRTEDQFTVELLASRSNLTAKDSAFGSISRSPSRATSVSTLTDNSAELELDASRRRRARRQRRKQGSFPFMNRDGGCLDWGELDCCANLCGNNHKGSTDKSVRDYDSQSRTTTGTTRQTIDTNVALMDRVNDDENGLNGDGEMSMRQQSRNNQTFDPDNMSRSGRRKMKIFRFLRRRKRGKSLERKQ